MNIVVALLVRWCHPLSWNKRWGRPLTSDFFLRHVLSAHNTVAFLCRDLCDEAPFQHPNY